MRLVSVSLPPAVTGGTRSIIRLARVSILIGANDAGKTRILSSLDRALDTRWARPPDLGQRPTVFVELERTPAAWLAEVDDDAGRREVPYLSDRRLFGRPLDTDFAASMAARLEANASGLRGVVRQLHLLRHAAGLTDHRWDPLFDVLAGSRLAAISPDADGWRLDWCLPRASALPPDALDLLGRLDMDVIDHGAPIVVTPLLPWRVAHAELPPVITLPADEAALALDDKVTTGMHAAPDEVDLNDWTRLLEGCFLRLAARRLPDFVASRYTLLVDHDGVPWFERLQGGTRVRPSKMAAGFRLWIDLAMLDAWEALRALAHHLAGVLDQEAAWPQTPECARLLLHLKDHDAWLDAAVRADLDRSVELVVAAAPALIQAHRARSGHSHIGSSDETPLTLAAGTGEPFRTLFLLDEPERHLHPALAREAAAWLQRVAEEDLLDGQVLLATHSPQLMGLTRGAAFTQVRRPGTETILVDLPGSGIDTLDALSFELGISRGELMTLKRSFVFVEGLVDRLVFETLFGERLHAAGVQLIAMHGTSKMQAVIESDLLFEHFDQRIAVIVDNIVEARLPQTGNVAELERITKGRGGAGTTELRKVAQLLLDAHHKARRVEVNAIGGPDIIAELDADVVREVQGTSYPGFEQSEAEQREAGLESWKGFCVSRRYFSDTPEAIEPVVEEMRRRGRVPADLDRVVRWLEELDTRASA